MLQRIAAELAAGHPVTLDTTHGDFTVGDTIVQSHQYAVISVNVAAGTITLRNPRGTDANDGSQAAGFFVQGADDGYVTFTFDQAFRDLTDDFHDRACVSAIPRSRRTGS